MRTKCWESCFDLKHSTGTVVVYLWRPRAPREVMVHGTSVFPWPQLPDARLLHEKLVGHVLVREGSRLPIRCYWLVVERTRKGSTLHRLPDGRRIRTWGKRERYYSLETRGEVMRWVQRDSRLCERLFSKINADSTRWRLSCDHGIKAAQRRAIARSGHIIIDPRPRPNPPALHLYQYKTGHGLIYRDAGTTVEVDLERRRDAVLIRPWRMRPYHEKWTLAKAARLTLERRARIARGAAEYLRRKGVACKVEPSLPTSAAPISFNGIGMQEMEAVYDYLLARGSEPDYSRGRWEVVYVDKDVEEPHAYLKRGVGLLDVPKVFRVRSGGGHLRARVEGISGSNGPWGQFHIDVEARAMTHP